MNKHRYFISFLITVVIYILIFSIFLIFHKKNETQKFQRTQKAMKLSLKNFKIPQAKPTKVIEKKQIKEIKIDKKIETAIKKIKEKKENKKIIVKKTKKTVKKIDINTTKKTAIKKIKKYKKTSKPDKKLISKENNKTIKKRVVKKESTKNPLISFLKQPDIPTLNEISKSMEEQKIDELYQGEFDSFTNGQKEFIKHNLSAIGKITQKYLYIRGYPDFAIKTRQEGINIVEFYLHPNGDITDLKIIKSSGYAILDENSIETIKTAYKDYPRPKEKTKIKIYIHYKIIY